MPEIFLELQCSVDDLVDFLELSMFINTSLPLRYYLMKWIVDSDMKKIYILLHTHCMKSAQIQSFFLVRIFLYSD